MAKDKKVTGDLGSLLVEEMRLQLNRLTAVVEAIKAAADANPADGNGFVDDVAALTELDDLENILTKITMPPAPSLEE